MLKKWVGIYASGGINAHIPDKIRMKRLLITIIIAATAFLSGCAPVFLVGAGVGAGAFSYVAGNLSRVYEADYQQSIEAGMNVMEKLSFKRKEEYGNELKTIIEGYLYLDTPVTIEVVYIDDGWTKIGVRTGYYGIDNLEKSEQVHTDIAEELKTLKQRNLKAISRQRKGKSSQSKPETSQVQYEARSPAAEADTAPVAILASNTKKIIQEDEAPYPAPETESASITSQIDVPQKNKQEEEASSPAPEIESASIASQIDDIKIIKQEKEAASPVPETESASIASQIDYTTKIKQEEEAPSPVLETESKSASIASQTDSSQTFKQDQENLFLVPNRSKIKTFIYYPKSTIAIPPGSYVALDDIVSQLIENPSTKVDIQGYTDSSGNKMKNLAVSYERAYEIRNYLIEKGIAEERITAQGLGATNFLESNRTERLRTMNRRVEITIK